MPSETSVSSIARRLLRESRPLAGRLLHESRPIAGIVLLWVGLSWLAGHPLVGTGARYAGVVMAGAYAVARGVALARESSPLDPGHLRGNVAAALAGGAWLLAARLVLAVDAWADGTVPGLFRSPAGGLAFALTATGVLTVLLAAVAVTLPRVGADGGGGENTPGADVAPTDD